jgi:cytochrome oxidase Cu insertion factor (SCO1/SenC/PrrC family)
MRSRLLALAALCVALPAAAQNPAAAPPAPPPPPAPPMLDIGTAAPDFSAPGATKAGLLKSVSLSQFKGKTVVIAFFYQARTKG